MSVKTHQSVSNDMRNYSKINPKEVDANIKSSDVIIPTDSQSRLGSTIQTHSGVVIPPSGTSLGNYVNTWIDCDGFDKVGLTLMNDAVVNSQFQILWSNDNSNVHGAENSPVASNRYNYYFSDVKARYMKIYVINSDTTNPHTMSAWVYLKV